MKYIFIISLFLVIPNMILSQVSTTFSDGDQPVGDGGYDGICSAASTVTVTLPSGGPYYITSVDVTYDITTVSGGGGWTSEQRSYLHSPTLNQGETTTGFDCTSTGDVDCGGGGTEGTTITYQRNVSDFNSGPHVGGMGIDFELRTWRTWPGVAGCNANVQQLNDAWVITVNYSTTPPPPPTYPGGVSTGAQLWMNGSRGLTASGWVDQINNNAYTASGGPTIVAGNCNFNNTISFDGIDDQYHNGTLLTLGEVYSVSQLTSGAVMGGQDNSGGGQADGSFGYIHRQYTGRMISGDAYSGDQLVGYLYGDAPITNHNNTFHLSQTAFMGDNLSNYQELNGLDIPSTIVDGGLAAAAFNYEPFTDDFYLGRANDHSTWLFANGGISEIIVFSAPLSALNRSKVSSYLAIKYGITLGVNGTSMDYVNTAGVSVWTQTDNASYAYDIAGISLDEASDLNQPKSRSMNQSVGGVFNDILIIANSDNFSSPVDISTDQSSFLWGHNNGPTINTGVMVNYPTDNGETIETIFQRHWKGQETGTINTNTLQFDLSDVVGAGNVIGANDLNNLRLLVDEDGDFSSGATSISPSAFDNTTNLAQFEHDFQPGSGNHSDQNNGYFFTLASVDVNATPLPVELSQFLVTENECEVDLYWETASEKDNDYFTIERSLDFNNWNSIITIDGAGSSQEMNYYSFTDRSIDENGVYYYRLKQVDFDGTITYSAIRQATVNCKQLLQPQIYPNPNSGSFNIILPYTGEYIIYSVNGKIIAEGTLLEGINKIDGLHLNSGLFTIKIESNDRTFVRKIIVR